nr:hypothetical protein [Dendronalium sp. ChiSLP03b]
MEWAIAHFFDLAIAHKQLVIFDANSNSFSQARSKSIWQNLGFP